MLMRAASGTARASRRSETRVASGASAALRCNALLPGTHARRIRAAAPSPAAGNGPRERSRQPPPRLASRACARKRRPLGLGHACGHQEPVQTARAGRARAREQAIRRTCKPACPGPSGPTDAARSAAAAPALARRAPDDRARGELRRLARIRAVAFENVRPANERRLAAMLPPGVCSCEETEMPKPLSSI